MSRIDEALRRTSGPAEPPAAGQQLFVPAWPVPAPDGSGRDPALPFDAGRMPGTPATNADASLRISSKWRERLVYGLDSDPGLLEQFRRLAATLHHAQQSNNLQSVLVTSATPGDGKTLTAVNLALVLAQSYRYNVLLVDADLRRPSIPNVIDLGDGIGLGDALRADSEQKLMLVPVTPRLTVLPAGSPMENSIEALTSPRMRLILDEAQARFDWVILDGPPVGSTADPRLLAEMVGGTLFVIHAGQTPFADVQRGVDAIGKDHILGVVLNGVSGPANEGYYYSGADQARQV